MRQRFSWCIAGALAIAIGAQALPGNAIAATPKAPEITITEHKVKSITGYHGGPKAEMDALATGQQPPSDPKNEWNGFTLQENRNQAASYTIPGQPRNFFGFTPHSILKITLNGNYTAVDVSIPVGTSPDAVARAVRAKEKIKADAPLLDTLGKEHKFVRVHELLGPKLAAKRRPTVTTYLPWTIAAWSSFQRKNAFNDTDFLKLIGKKIPPYLMPMIDQLQDRCEGVSNTLCDLGTSKWADILARTDQVVDLAENLTVYKNAPKATTTKPLNAKQALQTLDASKEAVDTTVVKIAKGKPAPKTPDFIPKSAKGWLVALSATALRAGDTFGRTDATALDKAESLLAAIPLIGETVGFANAAVKADPEGMMINIISLATLGAMHACPPAAFAGGLILVGHAIVKGLMGLFASSPVSATPPDVLLEQARNGAVTDWAPGIPKDASAQASRGGPKTVVPTLSNSYTISAKPGYAFTFSATEVLQVASATRHVIRSWNGIHMRVWQDGIPLYDVACTGESFIIGAAYCQAPAPTTVEPEHPIQVQILYPVNSLPKKSKPRAGSFTLATNFSGTGREIYRKTVGTFTLTA